MAGIGVIYNPRAGKNRKQKRNLQNLNAIINGFGIIRETRTEEDLTRAIDEFRKSSIDLIAVSGGDGTIHRVLTNVIAQYRDTPLPRFMALRSGTMNTFANSIKFKGDAADLLKRTIDHHKKNIPLRHANQHLMRVNDTYGFMTGTGVVCNFLDTYYKSGTPGPVHAGKMVVRTIMSALFHTGYAEKLFRPTGFRLIIDGRELEKRSFMFTLGCTIKELGLGFTPTPRAYDKPGHFHFLAATISPFHLVPKVPALYLGKDVSHREIQHNNIAENVIIEPEEEMQWMIDGDLYVTTAPLHLSVGPTITVVSPDLKKNYREGSYR